MELNENLFLEYTENDETEYAYSNGWKKVDSKEVKDSDGFMTEYTWYTNDAEDTHIFIFGDSDIYGPDDSYADAEFDSYDLAKEWFDNYYGFDHDEEDPDWVEFAEARPANDLTEASTDVSELSLEELVKDSINHLVNDLGRNSDDIDFVDDVVSDIENNYDVTIPSEPTKYNDWFHAIASEVSRQLNNSIDESVCSDVETVEEAIRPNLASEELQALAQKHNIKILDAMYNGDLRMEGAGADLMKFYQEAEKLGLWQVDPSLYECNGKVNETLTMHNFDEFKAIADEVGLVTAGDLERFRKEEMQSGESELDAIKRYKQELIDAGIDLSKLVNESLQEGAVKEIAMDIASKEKELKDFREQLDYLKSYDRKECGAGGQFDSTTELDAEISDTETSIEKLEKEIEELKAKVNA